MSKRIYLDYASLTPIDGRVLREMKNYSDMEYANPSSLYEEGVAAKNALADGRKRVADFLKAHADEIVFTSGGTESNGLALEGAGRTAHRNGIEKPHLIISAVEHSSIMECAAMMEKHGVEVTRLSVDTDGIISLHELKKSLKPSTFMVSIMTVNNEIGTIQPIHEIAKIIRQFRQQKANSVANSSGDSNNRYPLFHTDAAQGALYNDLNVEKLGVDLLTLDGSKVYGPRGIGALYVKRGTPTEQIMYGGGQERGLRSGTENIPAVMGFARALDIARIEREIELARLKSLKEYFMENLRKIRADMVVNGGNNGGTGGLSEKWPTSSPHILNVAIPGIDNEFFVLQLDAKGIACSTKSSCLRDEDESYVLRSIGADSQTSIRFSFGRFTKRSDIKKTILAISRILC